MADNNKDVDKKLKTSAKPDGLPLPRSKPADAGAAMEPKGLLDELDSKMDDLFALEVKPKGLLDEFDGKKDNLFALEEKAAQAVKSQKQKGVEPSAKKAEPEFKDHDAPPKTQPQKPAAQKAKPAPAAVSDSKAATAPSLKPAPPASEKVEKKESTAKTLRVSAAEKSRPAPAAVSDSKAATAPSLKPASPASEKIERKPVGKAVSGEKIQPEDAPVKQKPFQPEDAQAALPPKAVTPTKEDSGATRPAGAEVAVKPDAKAKRSDRLQNKESKKPVSGQVKKKYAILKLAVGGIILIGGVLALFIFFKAPEPTPPIQSATAPQAHKVIKPPAKTSAAKAAPPAASPVPPPLPDPAQIKPEFDPVAVSVAEKKPLSPAKPVTVSLETKKPLPPAKPVINTADEIKAFLQEWKVAWENSVGAKGDTDALMMFYSEDFTSNGFDKKKWRQEKAEKNKRKESIRIQLDNINVAGPLKNGRYEAGFTQVYRFSNYADTSNQALILRKEASGWKIIHIKPQPRKAYPYSIHNGSYRTLPVARESVEAFRSMGLDAYWAIADLGENGTWYRIFIGYYNNRESAVRMIKDRALKDVSPQETKFANRIGTYISEVDMQVQRRLLLKNGYAPYVIMDADGNLNLYTGAYITMQGAEQFSAELSAKGISSRVVER